MKSYLSLTYKVAFLLILFILYLFEGPVLIFLFLGLLVLFLWRKKKVILKDSSPLDIYAPVSGKVREITNNDGHIVMDITIPWWRGYGIHLPFTSEIKDRVKGRRKEKKNLTLSLEEINHKKKIVLSFIPHLLGGNPQIDLMAGDRGRGGVSIGHFPGGGRIKMTCPTHGKVLAIKGQQICVGELLVKYS